MCTVTVYQDDTELLVTMNRDEARSRGEEIPPTYGRPANALHWLGPLDSETRGTWIGVNEMGLVACLLNRYQNYEAASIPENPQSRGAIVPSVLRHPTLAGAEDWLLGSTFTPALFPPFTVLLIEQGRSLRLDWTGEGQFERTALKQPWAMITSSFFDPDYVLSWRAEAFAKWLSGNAPFRHGIPSFHLYQPAGLETIAPLMARDVSCTRSITQIRLTTRSQAIHVQHGPIDDSELDWTQFSHRWDLARRAADGGNVDAP